MALRLRELLWLVWRANEPIQLAAAIITIAGVAYAFVARQPVFALYAVFLFSIVYSIVLTFVLLSVVRFGEVREESNECTVRIDPDASKYHLTFDKTITNVGSQALDRLTYWVFANRFPDEPKESYSYYQSHPLIWRDLQLRAWDDRGSLDVTLIDDLNARKDFCIHLAERGIPRPLMPRETRRIHYSYSVPFSQFGPYIDRPIIHHTRLCRVCIQIPITLPIQVGGIEVTPLRGPQPLDQPITRNVVGDIVEWRWQRAKPALGSKYRLKWDNPVTPQVVPLA